MLRLLSHITRMCSDSSRHLKLGIHHARLAMVDLATGVHTQHHIVSQEQSYSKTLTMPSRTPHLCHSDWIHLVRSLARPRALAPGSGRSGYTTRPNSSHSHEERVPLSSFDEDTSCLAHRVSCLTTVLGKSVLIGTHDEVLRVCATMDWRTQLDRREITRCSPVLSAPARRYVLR